MKHFRDDNDGYYRAESAALGWVEIPASEWETANPAAQPDPRAVVQAQIDRLERQHLLPRAVREFMLALVAERAAATGKLPTDLPAFVKLKALDDQITALRMQL